MLTSFVRSNARRRGVVLVVVLGMLGLLALIGVTFATFSGQAQIGARGFASSRSFPEPGDLMDYALAQLIGDASKPDSVIRGHSLLRDMYGVDAATNGPLLSYNPDATNNTGAFQFLAVRYVNPASVSAAERRYAGTYACTTNIPTSSPTFAALSFDRWVVRLFPTRDLSDPTNPIYAVARTFEVLGEDVTGSNRVFYIPVPNNNMDSTAGGYPLKRPPTDPAITGYLSEENPSSAAPWTSVLRTGGINAPIPLNAPFALDGRYLRAFNGPGMAGLASFSTTRNGFTNLDVTDIDPATNLPLGHPLPELANFRYNGNLLNNVLRDITQKTYNSVNGLPLGNDLNNLANNTQALAFAPGYGDPNRICGMDEDYDACDLENWFLSIQSADGKVVIPSFHRPGILTANDWTNRWSSNQTPLEQLRATRSMSKILRPRAADGHSPISFPDLVPDSTGRITYDVDNDGDGQRDAVWLDLGYPARRNPLGQLYKPLFAFTVIGLNGKLPLNSAGNVQQTVAFDDGGAPPQLIGTRQVFNHAEHLGYSPSEIDLRFALQNAYNPLNPNLHTQYDNTVSGTPTNLPPVNDYDFNQYVALTQLRNLLMGTRPAGPGNGDENYVLVNGQAVVLPNNIGDPQDTQNNGVVNRGTEAVPGRWGEEFAVPSQLAVAAGYTNRIGPGMSVMTAGSAYDARDDNKNTFDDWPLPGRGEQRIGTYEADRYDAAGALSNAVERMRRFVTPVDLSGNGRVWTWNGGNALMDRGPDRWGRVAFFNYFRPPGVPAATEPPLGPAIAYVPIGGTPASELYLHAVRPAPIGHDPTTPDTRNNRYHAYEAARNPAPNVGILNPLLTAGSPTNLEDVGGTTQKVRAFSGGNLEVIDGSTTPPRVSSISNDINSGPIADPLTGYTYISPGLNEADEMNLYQPSPLDSPFGAADLEWLYRYHDVDGQSLNSRLSKLAPISFVHATDSLRRRRLFALDSWEPTNFVWANDNPGGVFPNNSRFRPYSNASFTNLNNYSLPSFLVSANIGTSYDQRILNPVNNVPAPTDPAYDFSIQAQVGNLAADQTFASSAAVPTPSLAHRDRRINLNFPLPVSNSPEEPVRQKWIRETYQLLKAVLPPKAIDTPEELARLSQFVVNIVDFRDPDATTTKFVNTDLILTEPTDTTTPVLAFSNDFPPGDTSDPARFRPAYDVRYEPLNSWLLADGVTRAGYLIQYGMENLPVAINEVLALRFNVNKNPVEVANDPGRDDSRVVANDVTRMFIELASTLSKSAAGAGSSTLDMNGWDLVVMPDNGRGRPDPITGQIPNYNADWTTIKPVPVRGGTNNYAAKPPAGENTLGPLPANLLVPALQTDATADQTTASERRYYYVLGNAPTAGLGSPQTTDFGGANIQSEAEIVSAASQRFVDLTGAINPLTEGRYYWLYLRRPPNPFDNSFDYENPNNNRVVVDSFRFVFTRSKGYGWTEDNMGTKTDRQGGAPDNEFIFSLERMQPLRGGHAVHPLGVGTGENFVTAYGFSEQTYPSNANTTTKGRYDTSATGQVDTTGVIHHTLGTRNDKRDDARDYLVFHDRDFTSVAELLLVPGCPPGLFTKQFVEAPPGQRFNRMVQRPRAAPLDTTEASWNNTAHEKNRNPIRFRGNDNSDFSNADRPESAASRVFPYLRDEFFYTGQSEFDMTAVAPAGSNAHWLRTEAFGTYQIGGPSGAGWYKMLEFFEVPSTVNGATGKVADGANFDWARQDLRPGLLNLNLIIDEEVFFGLMGPSIGGLLNRTWTQDHHTPKVVTQVNEFGVPTAGYHMPNVGFLDLGNRDVSGAVVFPTAGETPPMKAAFADFLKLRHGGSGYIFGYGRDSVGAWGQLDAGNVQRGIAADRPYRSLSFPDINYTILRPAALPPSDLSDPPMTVGLPAFNATGGNGGIGTPVNTDAGAGPVTLWVQDPGLKNPYLTTKNNPIQPPPIPPRRLFQVPDEFGPGGFVDNNGAPILPHGRNYTPGANVPLAAGDGGDIPSNAAQVNEVVSFQRPATYVPLNPSDSYLYSGDPLVNTQTIDPRIDFLPTDNLPAKVSNRRYDLTTPRKDPTVWVPPTDTVYLGGHATGSGVDTDDQRDHPYFRSEWLQKMANLTTVRTHQYAVWITVGFFEVIKQGDPQQAQSNPLVAYDVLGLEVGALEGRNVRYRGFFLVDRTRAIGFNPAIPGDFRDTVVYRQLIE